MKILFLLLQPMDFRFIEQELIFLFFRVVLKVRNLLLKIFYLNFFIIDLLCWRFFNRLLKLRSTRCWFSFGRSPIIIDQVST